MFLKCLEMSTLDTAVRKTHHKAKKKKKTEAMFYHIYQKLESINQQQKQIYQITKHIYQSWKYMIQWLLYTNQ